MRHRDYSYYLGGRAAYMDQVINYFEKNIPTKSRVLDIPVGSGIFAYALDIMPPFAFLWTRKIAQGTLAETYPGLGSVRGLLTEFKLMFGRSQTLILKKKDCRVNDAN